MAELSKRLNSKGNLTCISKDSGNTITHPFFIIGIRLTPSTYTDSIHKYIFYLSIVMIT